MGQEIFYCSKCQVRLRSPDFESGKAFRIKAQICCAACGQELVRGLSPEAAKEFLQGLAAGREAADKPASTSSSAQPKVASTARIPVSLPAPERSSAPLLIGIAVVAGIAVLAILAANREPSTTPPAARPSADFALPLEAPSATPRTPEEIRKAEAARAFEEIQAMEKSGRFAADEIRRRYAEFAKAYPDLPQSRGIEVRLKTPEPPDPGLVKPTPKPAEPAVEPAKPEPVPKPPEPVPTPEPVAKPPVPAPEKPAPNPEPSKPKRPAVPEAAKLREAEAALKKTYAVDQAKSPREKADLARTLLTTAAASGSGEADLFVRLRLARDLASAAAEPNAALQAVDAMAIAFELDALGEKTALLTRIQVRAAAEAIAWARACADVAKQASTADDHEAAGKLAARGESLAVAAKDITLRDELRDRAKEYAEFKREWDRLKPFQGTLKTAPDDPGACTALGRYLCLIKEDWDKGLPLLAKGSDGPLKKLAELELAKPTEASDQGALGEAWAVQSEKEPSIPKARAKLRALGWLERALPALSGPAKTSAEKALSQLGSALGSKAPPVLELGAGVKLELIYCRPGSFAMGETRAPLNWEADARPVHRVELTRGFFLGKYEVTRGQFAAFVKATSYVTDSEREGKTFGRVADGSWADLPGVNWRKLPSWAQTDDDPVLAMSWNDAKAFCDWAASVTKRKVRLPTEAEWEYACRAGTTTPYSFGSDPLKLGEFGWVRESNMLWVPQPVGKKKPNPWGFFDMHGNAYEWCMDFLGAYKGDVRDPEGPPNSEVRALRGGSYVSNNENCLSSSRLTLGMSGRQVPTGFRVAVR